MLKEGQRQIPKCKKGFEWLVMLICLGVGEALGMAGVAGAAMVYMMATELVSLMENLSIFGLKVPMLEKILDVARGESGETETEKKEEKME